MRSLKFVALFVALNTGAWIIPQEAPAQQGSVSFQLFYDELSPYGMWVDYPNYGYVWIPNGDPGFSPYATSGHWIFTDDGWTWISDYPWGWAPFHYGRWDYDNTYGWFWVPDNEWGPAWVSWRRSPGYYGWAPLRPGISISIAFGSDYRERNERWTFVRERDITRPDVSRRYVNRTNNVTIINSSTVIVNTRKDNKRNATYIAGPDRNDVQKVTRTVVPSVAIRENAKPGYRLSNGELKIYRPQVQRGNTNGQKPVPSKVVKLNDVKPASERNAGNRPPDVRPAKNDRTDQPPKSQNVQPSKANKVISAPDRNTGNRQPVVNPMKNVHTDQPPKSRNVQPSNNSGKEKQPPIVNPNNKREKQPQTVAPSRKNVTSQPSQPRTNQSRQDAKKQDDEKKRGR